MLLRFSAANHLSLRDAQVLSLTASSLTDIESGLIPYESVPGKRVLPIAIIYGANASGKSNVVDALRWVRNAVLVSHSQGEPDGGVPRRPFALDEACANQPSTFEMDFVAGGVRHHYGFEASDTAFVAEWLYAFPEARRQVLFERKRQEFKFGEALKGRNRVISELTRPNSLFVSAAAQNDHKRLLEISAFFRSLRVYRSIAVGGEAAFRLARGGIDSRVIEFLGKIGTGVTGYRRTPVEIPEAVERGLRSIVPLLQEMLNETTKIDGIIDEVHMSLELAHRRRDGGDVYFGLNRESSGTRRLLVLLEPVFKALDGGTPLVVDELDASLHTQACEAVLALFSSPRTNPKGAQLITTTHDTNLLSSPLLRRDQIWFTEKDADGATHLYPLTDIRTRKGDNIEKGYLQGRYGAVPFSGRLPEVLADG